MNVKENKLRISKPKKQLVLYGYKKYFDTFLSLYKNKKLPNVMLLSGPGGSGKSTFAYHFINYIFSYNEEYKYELEDFTINAKNYSFQQLSNNTHPNFFLIENSPEVEFIKIEQVRKLIKFLNKSTYSKNIKIVLIDNIECLNSNSSNALLKSLEEPNKNTFFIFTHDSSASVLDTIQSRCVKFKFYFNTLEKKNIFNGIMKNYQFDFTEKDIENFFYYNTPGYFLNFLEVFQGSTLDIFNDKLSCILYLVEKFKTQKDSSMLKHISLLVEQLYMDLSLSDSKNLNSYYFNKNKILYLIDDMKKFNLDKKNLLISIDQILKNEFIFS